MENSIPPKYSQYAIKMLACYQPPSPNYENNRSPHKQPRYFSKFYRRRGKFGWNGDFRRYLYEALVISIGKVYLVTEKTEKELI